MLVLADTTGVAEGLAGASTATSMLVALLAATFSGLALSAMRKRGNRSLVWVAAAFALFAAKNVFSAVNVSTHLVEHDTIELVLSLSDLAILLLLFTPFILRKRSPG